MSFKPLSALRRGFGFFWRTLDATRRTFFNLIFLFIIQQASTFGVKS